MTRQSSQSPVVVWTVRRENRIEERDFNDTWGHRAGDTVLREVGRRLKMHTRQGDAVGRYGGEEFVLVLTNSDLQAAREAAERLRVALAEEPCMLEPGEDTPNGNIIAITASIGVAVYGEQGTSREALIEAADRAMYYAKQMGRNQTCLLTGEQDFLVCQVACLLLSCKDSNATAT